MSREEYLALGAILAGERVERRLAAVLAADVAGYSRLMGADEEGTLARLKAVRKNLVDPTIASNRGRIVKTTGDGMLVEFASAVDAARSAVAVQRAMAEQNADVPQDFRIEFRIGIHVGDIIIDDNDIFGDGVNIAARLEGIAEPGGVCMSNDAFRQIRGKVEIVCDDMGPQPLKNIAEPMQAWRVLLTGQIHSAIKSGSTTNETQALPLLDKPSIAVLPFQNMSGDPEQEYFADGLAEDIITELSRFRDFAVIARNSTFFYKGKPLDVAQVARDLKVRYVLEGSVRKIGNRVRVTAQLIDAVTNDHLWAERYDREQADVFDLQEEITRTVVASIGPQIELAEIARSWRDTTNLHARQLAWRAGGLYLDAYNGGNAALMQQAITACQEAIAADSSSLAAHFTLAKAHWICHLYRWGDRPDGALDRAWAVVERMTAINSQDERTLTVRGLVRVNRGEYDGGLADLRRAYQINPNYAAAIIVLAFAEATTGLAREAEAHAKIALRLSPRDYYIGTAHLALAMAHFTLRNYDEAVRWCESAIQVSHRAPIRRALMIACSARAGDMARAGAEIAVLDSFAPGFIASVFRGENPVFTRKEDMEHLLDGLRLAGLRD
jgi:TolB-like protein/class 3 adenylate cyclase